MAASSSTRLLPSDLNLDTSASDAIKVSSARHRRRTTTKQSGMGKSRIVLSEKEQNSLELVSPATGLSHSTKQHLDYTDRIGATPIGSSNGGILNCSMSEYSKLTISQLTSSARQRRSQKRRKPNLLPPLLIQSELEDSTTRVANLLQENLRQMELDETDKTQLPVTQVHVGSHESDARHGSDFRQMELEETDKRQLPVTQVPVGESHESDAGHSSGIVTDEDSLGNQEPVNIDHPLPSSASQDPNSHDLSTTPPCTDILNIVVNGTDDLQASVYLIHPSVKVSIVDVSSGSLLKKSIPEKCVTSYYEMGNPSVDYILPIMTQPYEFKHYRAAKGTLKALWEETLIFNEKLTHFTSNEDVVIFFELLDFLTVRDGRGYNSRLQSDRTPWHQIAWAFLRPAGRTCRSRMGQKIRLQLYKYPGKAFRGSTDSTEVYNLWSRHYRSTYPSTLYVTLHAVSAALPVEEASKRSMLPFQEEKGSFTFEELSRISSTTLGLSSVPSTTFFSVSKRLPGQACHIPTSPMCILYPTPMGCSSLAFSHSGHLLAAGCADQNTVYPLVIYKIPSFEPAVVTEGHRGIIYQISWDEGDKHLVSASADGIVKLWSLEDTSLEPVVTLPHPCYVYCVCFMTQKGSVVLSTGAYDGYIRIWSIADGSAQMIGEFRGHSGHINCMVWSSKGSILYVGDSMGILGTWQKKKGVWKLKRKTDFMNGQSLVSISLHPNGRKMLLHTLKGKLAMIDLRINHINCEYVGIQATSLERCVSMLSPCGGLVFAGTPNGIIHVWSADTGKQLHVYSKLPFSAPIGAMAYHPSEHMLVLSSFGSCQPLVALNHIMGSAAANLGNEVKFKDKTTSANGSSVELETQLKMSQRLNDLTKTLDKVTARTKT